MPSDYNFQPLRRRFVAICTSRCNFNCPHCIRQEFDELKNNRIDIPLPIFELCLEELKKINYHHVSFTGGEPILHPEFEKLIAAATEADYTFNIVSNGWLYKDYFPVLDNYRFNITSLDFSLDGSVADIHDKIRNKPGSYQRVIEAIKFFKSKGFTVSAVSCFNQFNLDDIRNIYQLVCSLGVNAWSVLGVDDILKKENSRYELTDKDRMFLRETVFNLRKTSGTFPLRIKLSSGTNPKTTTPEINFCIELFSHLGPAVFPDGSMLFCCDIHKSCPERPFIQKDGFWNSFRISMATMEKLKLRRLEDILEGNFFDGFNTCDYCNRYIEEIIKDLRKE